MLAAAMLEALQRSESYPPGEGGPIELLQTHISWVFLTPEHAYKLKKPLKNNFLDYSTPALREVCCREELRLDSRYAGDLYLGVVPVVRLGGQWRVEPDADQLAAGQVVDFAVKMKRFPANSLLSDRLRCGQPMSDALLKLADRLADFHQQAARVEPDSALGRPERIVARARDNFSVVTEAPELTAENRQQLDQLAMWTDQSFESHRERLVGRRSAGFVRECHGDLHAGNIVDWHGELVPFDGIEFCDELRWIDVLSDLAFLAMDLTARGRPGLAWMVLNRYLERSGDYHDLSLLRWYQVYRAMVRSKVAVLMAQQLAEGTEAWRRALADCRHFLQVASELSHGSAPQLVITFGVSGSGKSTASGGWLESHGGIRVRSDVERKRLAGMSSEWRPAPHQLSQLYSPEMTARTYQRLEELATDIIKAGYSAMVDAAFLKRSQRQQFAGLAERLGVSMAILACEAPPEQLRARLLARSAAGADPSDADVEVLEAQLQSLEPLQADEAAAVIPTI